MAEQKRTIEEKMRQIHEYSKKLNIYKAESDEHGRYLLDSNNPHHRAWIENDDEYEVIEEE
jgi:hypothetical protein